MTKAVTILMIALLLAAAASYWSEPMPIDHRLIAIQASNNLPDFPGLDDEPIEVQAAIVDLGNDPLLLLKARAALMVYPERARTILPLYAAEPEFQRILRRHGEHVMPPIEFFLDNAIRSVEWMNAAAVQFQRARQYWSQLRGESTVDNQPETDSGALTSAERGWYAVNFIDREGMDFLGQFEVDHQGNTQWLQTERITEGVTQFFTGGIRQLESSYRTDGEVTASDIGWASVDVLVFASAVKFLRAGRAVAKTTQGARVSTRSAALAARITGGARLVLSGARYAKWPAIIGAGYLVLSHPSLISDFFAAAAEVFGLPPLLGQMAGWAIILIPALYLLSWLLLPMAATLRGTANLMASLRGRRNRDIL